MAGFGINQAGFIAVIWVFTGLATFLTMGRFYYRYRILKHLFWDDAFHFVAWILLLALGIIYTVQAPSNYRFAAISAGTLPQPPPDEFEKLVRSILRYDFALPVLFWTCLFCVKFAFLCLYRFVLDGSGKPMKTWWAVSFFVFVCYWICMTGLLAECGPSDRLFKLEACTSKSTAKLDRKLLIYQLVFNVLSDLIIMILPLPTLFSLQMRVSQKIAVAAIFLLVWVTIAFDILRLVESLKSGATLTSLYTSLETEFAVIVCSLPPFRIALRTSDKMKKAKTIVLNTMNLSNRSKGSSKVEILRSTAGGSGGGGSHDKAGSESWMGTETEGEMPPVPNHYDLRQEEV